MKDTDKRGRCKALSKATLITKVRNSICEMKRAKYKINADSILLQKKKYYENKADSICHKRKGFNMITKQILSVRRERLIMKSTLFTFGTKRKIITKTEKVTNAASSMDRIVPLFVLRLKIHQVLQRVNRIC